MVDNPDVCWARARNLTGWPWVAGFIRVIAQ